MSNSYWESFKEQNKDSWHFDPSAKSEDLVYVGRLKTDFKPLLDLMSDDKNYKNMLSLRKLRNIVYLVIVLRRSMNGDIMKIILDLYR